VPGVLVSLVARNGFDWAETESDGRVFGSE